MKKIKANILPKEEILDYLKEWKVTKDEKLAKIIVESNISFVFSIAKRYATINKIDTKDLIGEGVLGIYDAMEGMDLNMDNSFATYAVIHIKNRITRVCKSDFLVRPTTTISNYVWGPKRDDYYFHCREILATLRSENMITLSDGSGGTDLENIMYKYDDSDYSDDSDDSDDDRLSDIRFIKEAILSLDSKDRDFINLMYDTENSVYRSAKDICEIKGLSRQAIYVRRDNAIKRIRLKLNILKNNCIRIGKKNKDKKQCAKKIKLKEVVTSVKMCTRCSVLLKESVLAKWKFCPYCGHEITQLKYMAKPTNTIG